MEKRRDERRERIIEGADRRGLAGATTWMAHGRRCQTGSALCSTLPRPLIWSKIRNEPRGRKTKAVKSRTAIHLMLFVGSPPYTMSVFECPYDWKVRDFPFEFSKRNLYLFFLLREQVLRTAHCILELHAPRQLKFAARRASSWYSFDAPSATVYRRVDEGDLGSALREPSVFWYPVREKDGPYACAFLESLTLPAESGPIIQCRQRAASSKLAPHT
ncbi:hypothetical protein B0H13DRAFT_2287913 [Mycena leptocephala]|nr:hypothetical protein B0H13DRAFT_2287913 [Mycena leptocephala]